MTFRPLPARAPAALLREAKPLKALFGEAQRLAHLQRLLESQLQPAAREHCHVASWREGSLLLIVTDGHWATRLRYQQRRLQRQLLAFEEFATLAKILFKVQPPTAGRRATGRTIDLSPAAAENIQATAEGISDPKLRAALERLASRGKPRQNP
ncbi:MAG: DciA family protein [Pseudomonas sp.]